MQCWTRGCCNESCFAATKRPRHAAILVCWFVHPLEWCQGGPTEVLPRWYLRRETRTTHPWLPCGVPTTIQTGRDGNGWGSACAMFWPVTDRHTIHQRWQDVVFSLGGCLVVVESTSYCICFKVFWPPILFQLKTNAENGLLWSCHYFFESEKKRKMRTSETRSPSKNSEKK